eukprot:2396448-Rhodomonas_salina.1
MLTNKHSLAPPSSSSLLPSFPLTPLHSLLLTPSSSLPPPHSLLLAAPALALAQTSRLDRRS